jgi:hypothetical protein
LLGDLLVDPAQVVAARPDLLQEKQVRRSRLQPAGEALAPGGPQAVHIPGADQERGLIL